MPCYVDDPTQHNGSFLIIHNPAQITHSLSQFLGVSW